MKKKTKGKLHTVKRLLGMLLEFYPKLLPTIIVLIVFNAIISSLPSIFQQNVIAVIQDAWENGLTWAESMPRIQHYVLILATLYALSLTAGVVYNQLMAILTQGSLHKIRNKMFDHMESLPIRYFDTEKRGDIMSHYTNDVDALRQMISQSFPQLLISMITLTTILCIMMYYSVWMGLVIIAGALVSAEVHCQDRRRC
jgi:ATP-binding cassette subfamily B protein